ncbi:MAG TPA: AAA family ATPase [Acidimicrobiia bacterium]|nr:AAA family ATPase [Acidimicrobiia bacterium]
MDRRRQLAGMGTLAATSSGAALFADISGFTNLTEVLSRNLGARRGAEELTRLLNQVFGPITSAIHEHGGSVISFGGDSVTSWFDGDDGSQATAAALSLRSFIQVFQDQEAGGPAGDIDIKVAVVSGRSRRVRVGRPEHSYMDVLAGEVVERLSSEAELLQRGEVAVSEEVAEALGFRAELRTMSSDGRVRYLVDSLTSAPDRVIAIDDYAIDETAAREWLLPDVHEQIEQRLDGLMAELRDVVTVFVGFEGLDHVHDDDAGATLDACVSWAQEVLGRYEGVVLQVLIDDKGCHLYAVFGASISHEDEARRAVIAALELTEPSPESGVNSEVRVGIASGMAYVGSYGGPKRMTYGAHGPVVSLAARIMQQTPPGEVHVTEEIAANPSARVDFTLLGPGEFKGIDRAVTIHRATAVNGHGPAETSRRLTDGGMVGRDRERGVVASRLAQLHAGQGGTILIEGPAGIGKSRLLKDFVEQAELLGTTIITSSGEEIEQATAFYAWRPVLRQLFGGDGIEAEEKLLDFVANDPWMEERKGLLSPMVSVGVQDSDLIAGMEPELRGENTLRLLTAIVRGSPRASAPFVLVIDDGHWVDSASWAMAERAVHEIPGLLLVMATRPFGEGSGRNAPVEYERLVSDEGTEHVVLTELEPAEVMQLVEQSLGVTSVPGPVLQMIIDQAEGHPYFSEETAFALRDAGLLVIENGESRLASNVQDLSDVDFPNTVQDIIIGRFDRLSARQQSILKVASVIGREFSIDTLVEIYPVDMVAAEAVESLQSLVVLDLMQEVALDRSRYRFRHAITRDIAYGLLLFSQRAELHRSVAISMERAHVDDVDSVATTLAYHWRNSLSVESESVDVDKAIDYLGRAGRTSLRNFAHREAIGFLTDAIDLATPGGVEDVTPSQEVPARTLAQLEQDLAEAYLGMGRVDSSADHFERSLQLHGYPVGHGKFGVGARLLTASALQARHRLSRSDVSAAHAESREDLIEAATAYERLMKIYYYANDPGALITAAVSGLNLAEKAGTSPVLARIYANMSIVAGIVPIHRLARLYARRSREVADEVDRPPEHAWVRLATSVYGVGVGDWETTEQDLRDSLDLYKRLGDTRQMEENLGTTGQMMTAQGRFEEVYEIGEQLKESGAGRDDAQGELWGWLFQGTSLLRRGDYRTALARFRNGEALLDAGVGAINVGWLYGLMAETYWRLDDQDRARAAAASASQALYAERPGVVFALDGFTGVADVYLGQWATGRAREAATAKSASERAVKKLGAFSKVFPIGRPASLRYAGGVKEQAGDVEAARKEWEQGIESAVHLRMPYEEGRLRLSLGRLDKDRAHLEAARDLFESTGAAPFSEAARAALREI